MPCYSIPQLLQMASNAGFTGAGRIEIVAHALVESGGCSDARNSASGAAGILQFLPSTAAELGLSNPYDAQASFNAAYRLSAEGTNFKDWTPYEPASAFGDAQAKVRAQAGNSGSPTPSRKSTTKGGSGLLNGLQADPWGIGQGIADSVGYTGSTLGAIGRSFQNSGTLLVGLLVIAIGVGIIGWMFLTETKTGRGIRRIGKDAAVAAVVVPK